MDIKTHNFDERILFGPSDELTNKVMQLLPLKKNEGMALCCYCGNPRKVKNELVMPEYVCDECLNMDLGDNPLVGDNK